MMFTETAGKIKKLVELIDWTQYFTTTNNGYNRFLFF